MLIHSENEVATGNPWIDKVTSAFLSYPGCLHVVQGQPGTGKTFLSLRLAANISLCTGKPALFLCSACTADDLVRHFAESIDLVSSRMCPPLPFPTVQAALDQLGNGARSPSLVIASVTGDVGGRTNA